jgi:hypothetical protein
VRHCHDTSHLLHICDPCCPEWTFEYHSAVMTQKRTLDTFQQNVEALRSSAEGTGDIHGVLTIENGWDAPRFYQLVSTDSTD